MNLLQHIILILKQLHGIGILWMLFGYFCTFQYIFGEVNLNIFLLQGYMFFFNFFNLCMGTKNFVMLMFSNYYFFFRRVVTAIPFFFKTWNAKFSFFFNSFLFLGGFKDSASPVMEGIIDFHHEIFYIMILVVCFVGWFLSRIIYVFTSPDNLLRLRIPVYNVPLEIIWTIIPICLLALTVLPSFSLLYAINDLLDPTISIKVIGNQWYWIYEFTFFTDFHTIVS